MLDTVSNLWRPGGSQQMVSYYNYTTDNRGQRTAANVQGEAVGGSGFTWTYDYDSRGELADADHSVDTTRNRAYYYDSIGNRSAHVDGTNTGEGVGYTRNTLNQYTALVVGDPEEPLSQATLSYDADGNLTADGGVHHATGLYYGAAYTFVYDGENRLIEVQPTNLVQGSKKVTYLYDYRNRRARRQVFTYSTAGGGSWGTTPTSTTVYVWDGWRVLMELDGTDGNGAVSGGGLTIARKYTWGLDLAGQWAGGLGMAGTRDALEAAGGIGGLLAVHDEAAPGAGGGGNPGPDDYVFCYDGNGNVVQLVDWSQESWNANAVMVATYQYDPYGNVIGTPGGSYAATNRWRFSTKQFDSETGLGYWGYRWYSPIFGRWISRDPLQDASFLELHGGSPRSRQCVGRTVLLGTVNAVAYAANAPTIKFDAVGLCTPGDTKGRCIYSVYSWWRGKAKLCVKCDYCVWTPNPNGNVQTAWTPGPDECTDWYTPGVGQAPTPTCPKNPNTTPTFCVQFFTHPTQTLCMDCCDWYLHHEFGPTPDIVLQGCDTVCLNFPTN